jgi:uncharacterized protein (TIGR03084 family)
MDALVADLADQQAELSALIADLPPARWATPTRCDGWDVGDVVLHLAQTNEMAIGSATGRFDDAVASLTDGIVSASSIDDGAALMVQRERGLTPGALLRRWYAGAGALVEVLDAMDLSTRVTWVAGVLAARTLTTTRIAETWIHTGDVAEALGVVQRPTDRLREIARLAWRTLPYAFAQGGAAMTGPVAFHLTGPHGDRWDFVPEEPAVTTITGPAVDLCAVAARRTAPSATALHGTGPDVDPVLALVRTYA